MDNVGELRKREVLEDEKEVEKWRKFSYMKMERKEELFWWSGK